MDLHGVVFPRLGEYRFQLFADGYLLVERRITCRKIRLPPKAGPNERKEGSIHPSANQGTAGPCHMFRLLYLSTKYVFLMSNPD